MTTVLHGPGPTDDHIRQVHRFLTGRGWVADDYGSPAAGPVDADPDPEIGWVYPAAYNGEPINRIEDVSPTPPSVWFSLDSDSGAALVVVTAGNYAGCPEHDRRERRYSLGTGHRVNLDELAADLDEAEAAAREFDPRVLIECRFFGDCGPDQ